MSNLDFDMPQNQSSSIKVIGVGGGGSNAVNYMYHKGIKGVDFVVCNTDQQALDDSPVPTKIQLGVSITEGLGAGAWPIKGRLAAEENIKDIIDVLECNTRMVFINAGMGGGTGTGAAPVIAKAAKDMDILTVAIVTIPFIFEGEQRMSQAKEGIEEIKQHVDSLIVINNNKLREIYGNLGFRSGFAKADEILATASRGIAEVITQKGHLNIDLNDAKTVLSNSGTAIMGSGTASGDGRAIKAVKGAIESPLLDNNHIRGAKKVLLLIVSGSEEVTFEEMGEISDFIQDQVMIEGGSPADIIMGVADDEDLESSVNVTVVATGFYEGEVVNPLTGIPEKVVHDLEDGGKLSQSIENSKKCSDLKPDQNTEDTSDKIKYNLEDEKVVNSTLYDKVDKPTDEMDIFSSSSQQDQVSMTFDLNVSDNDSSGDKTLDDSNVIHNFIEDTEGVIEQKKSKQSDSEMIQSESEINDESHELSSEDAFVEKEYISFELNPDAEQNQDPIIDDTLQSDQKIIHSLTLDDESDEVKTLKNKEIKSFNSIPVKDDKTEEVSKIANEGNESTKILEKHNGTVSDTNCIEFLDKPIEKQKKIISSSSTNSKAVQEQIIRAQKRKDRLQKFNYRFRNNPGLELTETEPAYKRQGVELNDTPHSTEDTISNLNIGSNEDGQVELKSKNSFLHDNVD